MATRAQQAQAARARPAPGRAAKAPAGSRSSSGAPPRARSGQPAARAAKPRVRAQYTSSGQLKVTQVKAPRPRPRPSTPPPPSAPPSTAERLGSAHLAQRRAASSAESFSRGQTGRGVDTVQAGLSQGGQHALAAELLLFVAIVAVRAIAAYGPAPVVNGKAQAKKLPPDQYGPLFILGNGFIVFFILALLSARGGTWARLAAVGGLVVDLALLLKSIPHIQQLAQVYDSPRKYTPISLTASTPPQAAPPLSPQQLSSLEQPGGKLSGPSGATSASSSKAMSYAHSQLTAHGLKTSQWPGLVWLWNQESGWRTTALNPNTGATGIPQLNPNSHTVPPDWGSYQTQINWGEDYIDQTYGSIAAAVAHEHHFGWY